MSGEPKTLTLEEALLTMALEQGETLAYLHTPPNADPIDEPSGWVIAQADGWYRGHYSTWEKAASAALGVRVVARDEAAELREENHTLRTEADGWLKRVELLEAAIREWVEATSNAEMFELDQSNAYGTDHADAEDRVEAAAQALRRLAGGEAS